MNFQTQRKHLLPSFRLKHSGMENCEALMNTRRKQALMNKSLCYLHKQGDPSTSLCFTRDDVGLFA